MGPHENLGDLTYRTEFSGYEPVNGVWVPMSFNTVSDFRDNVQQRLHIDRYVLDGDVGDLAAPAAVRSASDASADLYGRRDGGRGGRVVAYRATAARTPCCSSSRTI